MKRKPFFVLTLTLMLVCSAALASNFRVADTIYLPIAGTVRGANNSFFQTDVWISNLSSDKVTIEIAFAPTAGEDSVPKDNRTVTSNPTRLSQGLLAKERREIRDIMGTVFGITGDQSASGMLIFFAFREGGTNLNCETANNDCRVISVEARIQNVEPDGRTYGQLVPGIPWYSYVSQDAQGVGLDTTFIVGIRQTAEFRTNIGLVNASQYSSTTLRVKLFNKDGTQFGSEFLQALPPLGHIQSSIIRMFPGYADTGGWITIEQANVTPTNPNDPIFGSGLPGFLAYGSLIDQRTNDPTWLETQFTQSFSDAQAICIFSPAGKTAPKRLIRR